MFQIHFEAPSLADMQPQELREWLDERCRKLDNHRRFVQRDLTKRARRHHGKPTYADRQYIRFQRLANDLLLVLESVIANIDQYAQEQAYIRDLEAEVECLREVERRRRLDSEIRLRQAEQRRQMDAAIRG